MSASNGPACKPAAGSAVARNLLSYADRVVGLAEAARIERDRREGPRGRAARRRAREGRLKLGRELASEIVERRVEDPYEPGTTIVAAFNRRFDVLERERQRLSPAAYQVGLMVQVALAQASVRIASGGWRQGDRVDAADAHEEAVGRAIERAKGALAYMAKVETVVGRIGARLLRQVLIDGLSFSEVAAARGRAGERGAHHYGESFREALEELAQAHTARGRDRLPIRAWREAPDPAYPELTPDG